MATEKGAQRVFIGLIVLSLLGVWGVASPFFEAFVLAAVLAGAFFGMQRWLTQRLGGRKGLAAGILTLGFIVILLAPLAAIGAFLVSETVKGVQFIGDIVQKRGLEGLLQYVPGSFRDHAADLLDRFQSQSAILTQILQEQLSARGAMAAQTVGGFLVATGTLALQVTMLVIALYFLLVDGPRMVAWLESVSPLKRGQTRELLVEFRTVSSSVLWSTLLTAGVQALVALVGYFIAGVPVPVFFGLVTFILALIPAVGGAAVCLVAAVILLATGHAGAAIFLAIWGVTVVGLSDNVVKPLLAKKGMNMHGALVFFALLGGLAVFGAVGLLLGPLILAFFLAAVRIYERDYGRPNDKPSAPSTPPNRPTVAEGEEFEPSRFDESHPTEHSH